jgi:hypothetical protein
MASGSPWRIADEGVRAPSIFGKTAGFHREEMKKDPKDPKDPKDGEADRAYFRSSTSKSTNSG